MDAPIKRMLIVAAAVVIATQLAVRCSESEAGPEQRLAAADALAAQHRIDDAMEAYRRAATEFPRDARVWLAYGDAQVALYANPAGADAAFDRAMAAAADAEILGPAARRSGLVAWARGDRASAEAKLRHAAEAGDAPSRRALTMMSTWPRSRATALAVVVLAWPVRQR